LISTGQRLVPQDQFLVHGQVSDGEEEPLSLADVGGVLAVAAGLGFESLACLGGLDLGGLEGILGLANGADRGGLHLKDGDLGLGPRLPDDLEELAFAVGLHVQGDDAHRAAERGSLSRKNHTAHLVQRQATDSPSGSLPRAWAGQIQSMNHP
jgi:hypothetical protein